MSDIAAERAPGFLVLGERRVGPGQPTLVVVEEGQANGGDLEIALRMIGIAAAAGADAIEFQLAIADDFYVRSHAGHANYRRREFNGDQLARLIRSAAGLGIGVVATALSHRLVPVLAELGCTLFNVNSSDLDNPEMLDAVAASGKPFLISTAMGTLAEVDWAVDRVRSRGASNFGVMHGQHVMATAGDKGVPEDHTNLAVMEMLRARYGVPVGFIDHTSNPRMPAIAVARGAAMVSKHFTYDRSLRGPDWHICLEPEELAETIRDIRTADRSLGRASKELIPGEDQDRAVMRRSIVAARDLAAGAVLVRADLACKRPGTGLAPKHLDALIGKRLAADVKADEQLQTAHLV